MEWIVTDDIYAETWRRLLEYSNIDFAFSHLVARHGEPQDKSIRANYRKQAQQARVCILQAKEYFDAARASSIFTSPNHAYYGTLAAASLMLLLLGDGTNSLDFLRKDNKNKHHGLDFTTGCSSSTAASGITLLSSSHVEIRATGGFANWYSVLPRVGRAMALVDTKGSNIGRIGMSQIGIYQTPMLATLVGSKRTAMDLMRHLPDITADLVRFGVQPICSRSIHKVSRNGNSNQHTWILHGASTAADLDAILENFKISSAYTNSLDFVPDDSGTGGIVTVVFDAPSDIRFQWPSSRETMNHETFSYAGTVDTHEVVDLYLLAYALSMLSRYYPDLWISCIESRCRAAKLIEGAVQLIITKLPIMALSLLSPSGIVISTHREPWK